MTAPEPPAQPAGPAPNGPADQSSTGQGADASQTTDSTEAKDESQPEADTGGSWKSPGVALRTGAASALRRQWATIHGDNVGGSKWVVNLGGRPVALREISVDLLDPAKYAFVDPVNWAEIRTQFDRHRTLIICGGAGSGKAAAGIRLLSGEARTIYNLDATVDLTELADRIAEQAGAAAGSEGGIGFLLAEPADPSQLRAFTFHTLTKALTGANARLVVTMRSGVLDRDLIPYQVELPDRAVDLERVFESHLRWRCEDDDRSSRLLTDAEVRNVLKETIADDPGCHSVAELAWWIWQEGADGGSIDPAAFRKRHRRHADQAFEIWFDSLPDVDVRSFAIALGALPGLPYEDVAAAARSLSERLDDGRQIVATSDSLELRPPHRDGLAISTTRLLEMIQACQDTEDVQHTYGTVPADVVRYRDSARAGRLVLHAWRRFRIQPILLEWLKDLAGNASDLVRLSAASAVGLLATGSFDYLRNGMFAGWAGDGDLKVREVLAYALREPAGDPRLARSVDSLVAGWFSDPSRPLFQATAARAYGLGVGGLETDAVLDKLGRLATVEEFEVAFAIGEALADLVVDDPNTTASIVCQVLLKWFNDEVRGRNAHLAFLILADYLVALVPGPAGGADVQRPMLLELARCQESMRAPLALLWRTVLCESVLHADARKVLTRWAGGAETDETQLATLLRLLRTVVYEPYPDRRAREIVLDLADSWIRPENLNPLPRVNATVVHMFAA